MNISDTLGSMEEKRKKKLKKALRKLAEALDIPVGEVIDFSSVYRVEADKDVYVQSISLYGPMATVSISQV